MLISSSQTESPRMFLRGSIFQEGNLLQAPSEHCGSWRAQWWWGPCESLLYLIHPDVYGRHPLDVVCKYITVAFLERAI